MVSLWSSLAITKADANEHVGLDSDSPNTIEIKKWGNYHITNYKALWLAIHVELWDL